MYEVIADLPITLNLLFNFSKQARTVETSNFHKSYYTFHLFGLFATFNLLGEISEITTPICETDVTRTSNFHHKNIMRLTSLELNCHFCYFANALAVSIFFYFLMEPLFFAHIK